MSTSTSRAFKNAAYTYLAEVGKALSSGVRLEILELLSQAPRTVEAIAKEMEQSVANTSQHLQQLKRAQLVKSTRHGLHILYEINGKEVGFLLEKMHDFSRSHLASLEKLTRDYFSEKDGLEAVDQETLFSRLQGDEVILIDVRPEHEYEVGHLPGALSMPLTELEERLRELPKDKMIVAYCRGPFCALSADAARYLRSLGYQARRTDATVYSAAFHS